MYPPPADKIAQIAYDILNAQEVQQQYNLSLQPPSPNRYTKHTTYFQVNIDEEDKNPYKQLFSPLIEEWIRRSEKLKPEQIYIPIAKGTEPRSFFSSDITSTSQGTISISSKFSLQKNAEIYLFNRSSAKHIAVASYGLAIPYAQLLGTLQIPPDYDIIALSPSLIEANNKTRKAWKIIEQNYEIIYDERKQEPPLFEFHNLNTYSPSIHRYNKQPIPDEIIAEKLKSSISAELHDILDLLIRKIDDRTISSETAFSNELRMALCFTPYDTEAMKNYINELIKIPAIYSSDRTAAYTASRAVHVENLPKPVKHFIYRIRLLNILWENFLINDKITHQQAHQLATQPNKSELIANIYEECGIDFILESLSSGVPLNDVL